MPPTDPSPDDTSQNKPVTRPLKPKPRDSSGRFLPEGPSMAPPHPSIGGFGYAKLQDVDDPGIAFVMRGTRITLGRGSESFRDVDLDLGDAMGVSRVAAQIDFNCESRFFEIRSFAKNGIKVDGVRLMAGSDPVRLYSRTIIEIGPRRIWFLLPVGNAQRRAAERKQISQTVLQARRRTNREHHPYVSRKRPRTLPEDEFEFEYAEEDLDFGEDEDTLIVRSGGRRVPGTRAHPSSFLHQRTVSTAIAPPIPAPVQPGRKRAPAQLKELFDEAPALDPGQHERWPKYLPADDGEVWRREAVRPPYSYYGLTMQSLAANAGTPVALAVLYAFIEGRYPYYAQVPNKSYKSCIRHCLSTNAQCLKVSLGDPQRAGWMLDPGWEESALKRSVSMLGHT